MGLFVHGSIGILVGLVVYVVYICLSSHGTLNGSLLQRAVDRLHVDTEEITEADIDAVVKRSLAGVKSKVRAELRASRVVRKRPDADGGQFDINRLLAEMEETKKEMATADEWLRTRPGARKRDDFLGTVPVIAPSATSPDVSATGADSANGGGEGEDEGRWLGEKDKSPVEERGSGLGELHEGESAVKPSEGGEGITSAGAGVDPKVPPLGDAEQRSRNQRLRGRRAEPIEGEEELLGDWDGVGEGLAPNGGKIEGEDGEDDDETEGPVSPEGEGGEVRRSTEGLVWTGKEGDPPLPRVCGSPAIDGYAHVDPKCLESSPTAVLWRMTHPEGAKSGEGLDCNLEEHVSIDGLAVAWGITHIKSSPEECCQACRDLVPGNTHGGPFENLPCNAWVYCPDDECFEADAHKHTKGNCWLKFTEAPQNPEINARGAFPTDFRLRHPTSPPITQWISGVLVPPGQVLTNGTWGPRASW